MKTASKTSEEARYVRFGDPVPNKRFYLHTFLVIFHNLHPVVTLYSFGYKVCLNPTKIVFVISDSFPNRSTRNNNRGPVI